MGLAPMEVAAGLRTLIGRPPTWIDNAGGNPVRGDMGTVVHASGGDGGTATIALVVAIAGACIAMASLVWNLALYRLSGARLQVRLIPAILTAQGHLLRGPDRGWRKRAPEGVGPGKDDVYVDIAIIKVTNVGRSAVSVSEIVLDFGRSGWRPGWRHTIGGMPIVIHECKDISGDVRLEAGQSISLAVDHELLVQRGMAAKRKAVRASATAAGRRPTLSSWRRRWSLSSPATIYYPGEGTPEQRAFVEVFRAVYPHDAAKLYEAWIAVTALMMRDSAAGSKEIADELAKVLDVGATPSLDLVTQALRIADRFPEQLTLGTKSIKRGSLGD